MATKVKLTVTIGSSLAKELDEEAKSRKLSRSALVEEAIRALKKKRLEESLKNGYRAMAEENLKVAEEMIHYGSEAISEK
jgi:metal-responsive CopG/Arc/MetJ family transcriptional regulator